MCDDSIKMNGDTGELTLDTKSTSAASGFASGFENVPASVLPGYGPNGVTTAQIYPPCDHEDGHLPPTATIVVTDLSTDSPLYMSGADDCSALPVSESSPATAGRNSRVSVRRSATDASIMQNVQRRIDSLEQDPTLKKIMAHGPKKRSKSIMYSGFNSKTLGVPLVRLVGTLTCFFSFVSCLVMYVVCEVSMQNVLSSAEDAVASKSSESADVRFLALRRELQSIVGTWRTVAISLLMVVTGISFVAGLGIGRAMSRPMKQLRLALWQLAHHDFNDTGDTEITTLLRKANAGTGYIFKGSWVKDFRKLEANFIQVARGIEIFERYLPETVVRGIVSGDERANRLHVSRREVTIMFADIADFTSISESLSQEDLLFMLTRYLSIMTRIVESFGGVVAEILGDGLLVFWNTPDDMMQHAAKAVASALAQQQSLVRLNKEFSSLKLPPIKIRIGIHTGRVLTGNIGSETKMKFGCMGDPMNLASRLEGLCKTYGVSIICSGSTYDEMRKEVAIFCRKLDVVLVKGRKEPTTIYEVMGFTEDSNFVRTPSLLASGLSQQSLSEHTEMAMAASTQALRNFDGLVLNPIAEIAPEDQQEKSEFAGEDAIVSVTPEVERLAAGYEEALRAYQEARFALAVQLAEGVVRDWPADQAAAKLLQNARGYVGEDGAEGVGLTPEELAAWTGVRVMAEK